MNYGANNSFPIHMQGSQRRDNRLLDKLSSRRTGTVFLAIPKPAYRKIGHGQLF